jgi:hypothetical protein
MTCTLTATLPVSAASRLTMARWQISSAMYAGGVWSIPQVAAVLRPVWEDALPSTEWLVAIASDDPHLHQVAPGRWVHVGAAVDDRIFTIPLSDVDRGAGIIDVSHDLTVPLARYAGWPLIPVRSASGRGCFQRVAGRSGRHHLVTCPHLLPGDGAFMGVTPGPEGLHIQPVVPQPWAAERLRHAMRNAVRIYGTGDASVDAWPVTVDVELAVLAGDPTLRRVPTAPLRTLVAATAGRGG